MTQTLSHRGPDDSGVWLSEQASIDFGQRRLAIIDLSPIGHQPMVSANGQYTITFMVCGLRPALPTSGGASTSCTSQSSQLATQTVTTMARL
jgi:hypothetical protein